MLARRGSQRAPRPRSPQDSTWLNERTPTRLDAEYAQRPLDLSFIQLFQQNLLSDPAAADVVHHLAEDTYERLLSTEALPLSYPLLLVPGTPENLKPEELRHLVAFYLREIHPSSALINTVPADGLQRDDIPDYLLYAMACIALQHQNKPLSARKSEALWLIATSSIAWGLELDNREARNVDMINAWALLGAFGTLSADTAIWRRTNTIHGYVEAAARRLYDRPVSHATSSSLPYLAVCDVVRAIHYGSHSTLAMQELLSQETTINTAFHKIYERSMTENRAPPADLHHDGALLALAAFLDDIHTVHTILGQLSTRRSCAIGAEPAQLSLRQSRPSTDFYNPYLPCTASQQNRIMLRQLRIALDLWSETYLEDSNQQTRALYHFCRMYLSLPNMHLLLVLARYPPRALQESVLLQRLESLVDQDLQSQGGTLREAWLVLNHVEQSQGLAAVWLPVATFYASLVVWRMTIIETQSGSLASLRVLRLFQAELQKMNWPCCAVMVATLARLMNPEFTK